MGRMLKRNENKTKIQSFQNLVTETRVVALYLNSNRKSMEMLKQQIALFRIVF